MPLSCGRFDGTQVECSYHGWTFDAHTGQCQLIPSLTADQSLKVERIYAGSIRLNVHYYEDGNVHREDTISQVGIGGQGSGIGSRGCLPAFGPRDRVVHNLANLSASGIVGRAEL